jgi:hypothetical protein
VRALAHHLLREQPGLRVVHVLVRAVLHPDVPLRSASGVSVGRNPLNRTSQVSARYVCATAKHRRGMVQILHEPATPACQQQQLIGEQRLLLHESVGISTWLVML